MLGPDLFDRLCAMLEEVVVKRLDERLTELVAAALRPPGIAGLEAILREMLASTFNLRNFALGVHSLTTVRSSAV
jgi:glutamate mutase epsilon subunit